MLTWILSFAIIWPKLCKTYFTADSSLDVELSIFSKLLNLPTQITLLSRSATKPPYPVSLASVNITLEVVGRGLNVKPFLELMLSNQNFKSAEASSVSWIGSYHVFRPSISAYKLLEKSRTMGPSDRCIAASWPATRESCLAEQKVWDRIVLINLISFSIFSAGTVNVASLVSIIVPNHFPVLEGVRWLFSRFTIQPPFLRSLSPVSYTHLTLPTILLV